MIVRYSEIEFMTAKSRDFLDVECERCHRLFKRLKKDVVRALNDPTRGKVCSNTCKLANLKDSNVKHDQLLNQVNCANCSILFFKRPSEIIRSDNHFCTRSCAATFNNTHKKYGNRRSKLEHEIEKELTSSHPNLEVHYNRKDTIGTELDIFIPMLKLAIELNGIFHYKPVFGQKKLDQIRSNDLKKSFKL